MAMAQRLQLSVGTQISGQQQIHQRLTPIGPLQMVQLHQLINAVLSHAHSTCPLHLDRAYFQLPLDQNPQFQLLNNLLRQLR